MQMNHDNKWKENFAAFVLIKGGELNPPFSSEWLKDKPDLQIGCIGIEVTESVFGSEAEEQKFTDRMLNKTTFAEAEKMQKKNSRADKFHPAPIQNSERFGIEYATRGWCEEYSIQRILSCIQKKQDKWKRYDDFSKRRLYIKVTDDLLGTQNHPLDATQIIGAVNNSIFDTVYLYLHHTLYVIGTGSPQPTIIHFSTNDENNIAIKTCKTQGCPEEHLLSYSRRNESESKKDI